MLVGLARDGTDEQKAQAADAIRNLACDNKANRDAVRESGGIPVLVGLARDGTDEQKAKSAGAIRNLMCHNCAKRGHFSGCCW